jgi:hypothetical protein
LHEPATHLFRPQYKPSSQVAALFAWTHPVAGLHESSVHALLSLQFAAASRARTGGNASPVVHAFPSSQAAVLFV